MKMNFDYCFFNAFDNAWVVGIGVYPGIWDLAIDVSPVYKPNTSNSDLEAAQDGDDNAVLKSRKKYIRARKLIVAYNHEGKFVGF